MADAPRSPPWTHGEAEHPRQGLAAMQGQSWPENPGAPALPSLKVAEALWPWASPRRWEEGGPQTGLLSTAVVQGTASTSRSCSHSPPLTLAGLSSVPGATQRGMKQPEALTPWGLQITTLWFQAVKTAIVKNKAGQGIVCLRDSSGYLQ